MEIFRDSLDHVHTQSTFHSGLIVCGHGRVETRQVQHMTHPVHPPNELVCMSQYFLHVVKSG